MGNGSGGFGASMNFMVVPNQAQSVAVGDFNGDGKLDLAVANGDGNNVSILLNTTTPPDTIPPPDASKNTAAGAVRDPGWRRRASDQSRRKTGVSNLLSCFQRIVMLPSESFRRTRNAIRKSELSRLIERSR